MGSTTIGIDTRWLEGTAPAAGINSYIRGLITSLADIDVTDRFHLWGTSVTTPAANVQNHDFSGTYRRAWQLAWKTLGWPPMDYIAPNAELWHFTNYVAPPTSTPYVVSVHDLTHELYPQFVEPKNRAFLQRFVPDTIQRAQQVIAISQSTKDAIKEIYRVPDERITVTPLAADPAFAAPVEPEMLDRIKQKYGIEGGYFLAVGTLEPRKNLRSLLLATAAMRRELKDTLVVVGGQGWLFDETKDLLRKLGLGSKVVFTGYVPQKELPALYAGAKLFVFPTQYEGFGIPVLEAMLAGTPVLCSNTSSLPEVAGGAALYFDPSDVEAIKLAVKRTLADDKLLARLAEAGKQQATQFTWRRTAEETLRVYRKALATTR